MGSFDNPDEPDARKGTAMSLLDRVRISPRTQAVAADAGLVVLRIVIGAVFIAHGWGDATQEGGAGANVENYRGAGIPLPELSAWFGAYMQLIGGALLIAGALTRLSATGLFLVMAGAVIWVHPGEPLVLQPDGSGSGFAVVMGTASLALVALGAGRFSADRAFNAWRSQPVDTYGMARSPGA